VEKRASEEWLKLRGVIWRGAIITAAYLGIQRVNNEKGGAAFENAEIMPAGMARMEKTRQRERERERVREGGAVEEGRGKERRGEERLACLDARRAREE